MVIPNVAMVTSEICYDGSMKCLGENIAKSVYTFKKNKNILSE